MKKMSTPKQTFVKFNKNINTTDDVKKVLPKYGAGKAESASKNKHKLNDNNKKSSLKMCVSIRVRPLSIAEKFNSSNYAVKVCDNCISVRSFSSKDIGTENHAKFQYDNIFWFENNINGTVYGDQSTVYETIARPLLHRTLEGRNVCLFAYGQTGSGKTYSMMGCDDFSSRDAGIIPRFCKELIEKTSTLGNISMSMSYYEIYNEKIFDLLSEDSTFTNRSSLKVREHPLFGPYVADLTCISIQSLETLLSFLILGNSRKLTSSTINNERSSRSHTILELLLAPCTGQTNIKSKTSLVDLAGSERVSQITNEERFKEGLSINRSLLTLGKVITALADSKRGTFVPYRESLLTWLLKESLGGNSQTAMLATISPSYLALDETLATLRWAHKASHIVCTFSKNDDPQLQLIKDLQNEVQRLKSLQNEMKDPITSSYNNISGSTLAMEQEYKQSKVKVELLQNELEKLETYLKQAESRNAKLQLERERIVQDVALKSIPTYESNFYNELKNMLNLSLNDSAECNFESLSPSKLRKQNYIKKAEVLMDRLEEIYRKEMLKNSEDKENISRCFDLINLVRVHLWELNKINISG